MKINTTNKNLRRQGFTLIEMIGVLAVIAILAAVLIPKVFEAINSARINNAAMTCQTVKTAIADHYAKAGTIPVDISGTTPAPISLTAGTAWTTYDNVLVREGFLDKPFAVKIGDGVDANNHAQLMLLGTAAAQTLANGFYDLDGSSVATPAAAEIDTPAGVTVVEAKISGVSLEDAAALDKLIDGAATTMSSPASAGGDLNGRVKWGNGATTGTKDVYIYLTHR